ncbi:thioesterase family protein [Actinokineospora guangxiensis]|uniref:Thioesterase family protein n=1 Tax=Actinokineospora guangxiensis TaxID=1490288 RepID=A0ABW0EKF4_9PSEU
MPAVPGAEVKELLANPTTVELMPGYEGANINTTLGFKHVNYLVEQAVVAHFANAGLPVGALYQDHGLGFDLTSLDTRLTAPTYVDDRPSLTVTPKTREGSGELVFAVTATVQRDGEPVKSTSSTVRAALRLDERVADRAPVPAGLEPFVVARVGGAPRGPAVTAADTTDLTADRGTQGQDPVLAQLIGDSNAHGWKWRVPYFYVHFFERLQMSGYLRVMEEVVDLFLAERGISIRTLLHERNWIPAVTRSRIDVLDEVLIEEDLYTVYTVEDVLKGLLYNSRMDCYVVRDGHLVRTATGTIQHGYADLPNARNGSLMTMDERVLRALEPRP